MECRIVGYILLVQLSTLHVLIVDERGTARLGRTVLSDPLFGLLLLLCADLLSLAASYILRFQFMFRAFNVHSRSNSDPKRVQKSYFFLRKNAVKQSSKRNARTLPVKQSTEQSKHTKSHVLESMTKRHAAGHSRIFNTADSRASSAKARCISERGRRNAEEPRERRESTEPCCFPSKQAAATVSKRVHCWACCQAGARA